ncbi:ATP-dependent nuclease [Clostridium botulinum]|uniref:ATP-dependent nuclease n=1 Tax=Clostridium botulinum TaxID=1491 RepID=UPI0007733B17|nr:AAA family ATPase [Clostridium botulinum]NFE96385.1 ATP-dependent endonuclease [Clostridium botulinum]NFL39887.1 ATP-dependent endonuclease [Clostridium botulinum]NFL66910.1 ATP-dependent endonuclease [Clostridium botulinum]NFN09763.1 ATP-dependent endonuclease [Clostridium botulinum]NFN26479.1 ATP-dependent endonuclease [Clostridium botulinum]
MNEINEIKKQFFEGQWKQFIKSITINNLRGWSGQTIEFRFPICAIVGENGIGKSTFLRAAACAYENKSGSTFYPSKLFINTQWDASSVNNAMIEYNVLEGDKTRTLKWKKTNDWGFTPKKNKPSRHTFFLDISRTLPLDATAGYAKVAKQSNEEGEKNIELNEDSLRWLSYVLGNNYSKARFTNTDINKEREIGLLTRDFGEVSQFHQGAGEDTILDTFKLLQSIPNQSVLIIDEVEASLHPKAQRRFIEYLLHICRTKKIQIILSTHSPFVFDQLPEEARIMLIQLSDRKEIMYKISTKFALSLLDNISYPELYIFVEDEEASKLLLEIIKQDIDGISILEKIAIREVGSSSVVYTLNKLLNENKLPYKGIAFIDGDKKSECRGCPSLPGDDAPERMVMTELKELQWRNLDERFGIGAGKLFKYLDDSMLVPDHHEWTTRVGDCIKQSKDYVWSILIEEWCKKCLKEEEKNSIINIINEKLNSR